MSHHALARLQERYGPDLGFDDLMEMRQAIIDGRAKRLNAESNKTSKNTAHYLVPHKGRRVRLVFAHSAEVIVTALPIKGNHRPKERTVYRAGKKYVAGR